jgi:hypothetical protein
MNKKQSQPTEGEANAKAEVIKLGLDLHVPQVTECWQLDSSTPKPAQQLFPPVRTARTAPRRMLVATRY